VSSQWCGEHWLGLFFGSTPNLRLNLQRDYDLQVAESAKLAAIA
jgi:plasmid maintenance system antidote protein VapI